MENHSDVKALDFAINVDCFYVIFKKDKQFVLGNLLDGNYMHSSGNLQFGGGEIVSVVRGINFPNAVNKLEQTYADIKEMKSSKIEFPENEIFTDWIKQEGQLGFYSKLTEEVKTMFGNKRRLGFDMQSENYSKYGESSNSFVGALVKIQDILRKL